MASITSNTRGEFTGTVHAWRFHWLVAKFIKDSGYMELEDVYRRRIADLGTTYTMVVMNGNKKTLRNSAGAGPVKLWAIEQLIDDLLVTPSGMDHRRPWKRKTETLITPNKIAGANAGMRFGFKGACGPGVAPLRR